MEGIPESYRSMEKDFEIKDGVLVGYSGEGGDVIIPDGVTSIGEFAFFSCKDLASVVIPDSVEEIGGGAFFGCCGLTLPIVGYTVHYEIGHDWIVRGNSIAKWLSDNLQGYIGEYQYAIVDDDDDMLMRQAGHFVQTNSYTGITESDIEKLRNILESNII